MLPDFVLLSVFALLDAQNAPLQGIPEAPPHQDQHRHEVGSRVPS